MEKKQQLRPSVCTSNPPLVTTGIEGKCSETFADTINTKQLDSEVSYVSPNFESW